jgi:probable HAF family extracellular repeat protein
MDIGNFDGGVAWNTPTAINNAGLVVGFANLPNSGTGFNPVGFIWSRTRGIRQLGPLAGDSNSWAWGVNSRGQVVGQSFGPGGRAFLYQDGVMYDLNGLLLPGSSLQLLLANDINDSGEIAGFAKDLNTGKQVAFLAVPVDDEDDAH